MDGKEGHSQIVDLVPGVSGHADAHGVLSPELDAAGTEHCFHDDLFPMLGLLHAQMDAYPLE